MIRNVTKRVKTCFKRLKKIDQNEYKEKQRFFYNKKMAYIFKKSDLEFYELSLGDYSLENYPLEGYITGVLISHLQCDLNIKKWLMVKNLFRFNIVLVFRT